MSWACSIVFHTQIGSVRDTAHDNYSLFSLSSSEGSISVQASSCTESGLLDRSQLLFSYTKLFQHLYHTTTHSQRFWQTSQLTLPLAGLLLNFLFTGNWTGYQIALPIPIISTLLPWQPIVTNHRGKKSTWLLQKCVHPASLIQTLIESRQGFVPCQWSRKQILRAQIIHLFT